MQHKLTTHKGDILLLVEVHKDTENLQIVEDSLLGDITTGMVSYLSKDNLKKDYELIGTISTLTELQANDLVEYFELESVYKNYNPKSIDDYWKFNTALESFNSLLEHNGVNLNNNYVILKLLNN
jgi:hypothetical protein